MFVMTKQAVLFHRPDGETFRAPNGYVGAVPDWVTETKQFKRQVAAGKIVASQTSKDKDMEAAEKAGKKAGKKNQGKAQSKAETGNMSESEPEETEESAEKVTEE
ncbi:hypothetical protein [uncultured Flavonifractor sp.]|uniref:hypothetical protein n=1 Tax=uncultured Flavonifractor sp. TaxID=1193534 RepID=UPI002604DC4D|nr:hypothetical protein [uncultured Flavonifractor sp.]